MNHKSNITLVIGPTSVGKTTWCQKKRNAVVIDIDKEWEKQEVRDNFQTKWSKKNKWNWNKFKKDYTKFLEKTHIPNQVELYKTTKKHIYLPHIEIPKVWLQKMNLDVVVLYRNINKILEFSQKRDAGDSRTYEQVIKGFLKLFVISKTKTKITANLIDLTKFKDIDPKLVAKYNKHFKLNNDNKKSYIKPNLDVKKIRIIKLR